MTKNLSRIHTYSLFFALLALVFSGVGFYLLADDVVDRYRRQSVAAIADSTARRITDRIAYYHVAAVSAIEGLGLGRLMKPGRANDRAQAVEQLTVFFPDALKVRLLPLSERAVDELTVPNLGYACLDIIQSTPDRPKSPDAEFHMLMDALSAHIDIPQSIVDAKGELLGHLLISLRPDMLQEMLDPDTGQGGYTELRQYLGDGGQFITLAKVGDASLTAGIEPHFTPITNTPWKLAVWPAQGPGVLTGADQPLPWLFLLLALVCLVLAPVLLRAMAKSAVNHDIAALSEMLGDIRSGVMAADYSLKLDEFRRLAQRLRIGGEKLVADHEALLEHSQSDYLTGLATKDAFNIRLDQLFDQTRMGFPSSVLLVEIDNLNEINDEFGHEAGDIVLKHFAGALKDSLRKSDFISRVGGGTFGIILSFTELDSARQGFEQLREKISTAIELPSKTTVTFTWSGGMSSTSPSDCGTSEVMARCQQALDEAKHAGGDEMRVHG